jgi:hypothetical protein
MVEGLSLSVTMMIFTLNHVSVWLMANYSAEQLRRKAHLANGGTLANYDRSHYDKIELGENNNDTSKTNNN